ncbi:hypothetical protein PHLCEN_2v173 [Hermanssonia centrifuga]|uniref:Uncharacterized protein n=1 Tax=Hermanssonia centrifuga TaxID=98765 RepID=A0A2R6S6S2_9APHY|nr:hypothetical protein PHLCEN_2v173 [Hermanssonia centrifuga]
MNCFRMIEGYVIHRSDPGGPVAYIGKLAPWDHVFKDTLYATQEILGDAVAVLSGYTVCGLYPSENSNSSVFDPRLLHWITTFYAISVVQSGITTFLMAFRIWQTDKRSATYRTNKEGNLMPILRILVESAFAQFAVEVILLSLYAANYNAQYLLLELVTPLVGITFNAITIRIALRQAETFVATRSAASFGHHAPTNNHHDIATIGSIPMRPMPISISITKDVEAHGDINSDHGSTAVGYSDYERKQKRSNSDDDIATVN